MHRTTLSGGTFVQYLQEMPYSNSTGCVWTLVSMKKYTWNKDPMDWLKLL